MDIADMSPLRLVNKVANFISSKQCVSQIEYVSIAKHKNIPVNFHLHKNDLLMEDSLSNVDVRNLNYCAIDIQLKIKHLSKSIPNKIKIEEMTLFAQDTAFIMHINPVNDTYSDLFSDKNISTKKICIILPREKRDELMEYLHNGYKMLLCAQTTFKTSPIVTTSFEQRCIFQYNAVVDNFEVLECAKIQK